MSTERNLKRVDFHVHYTDEDAFNIIDQASQKDVSALALIGRAEVSGKFEEFEKYGETNGIKILAGVEYPVSVGNDKYADLVALGFDYRHPEVYKYFGNDDERQNTINRKVAFKQKSFLESKGFSFENLDEHGQNLLQELLSGQITEKAIRFCRLVVNDVNSPLIEKLKRENNQVWCYLVERCFEKPGYNDKPGSLEAKFLWQVYFAPGHEGFVPVLTSAEKIIDSIHSARGVILYSPEGKFDQEVWKNLIDLKIDGVMGWGGSGLWISRDIIRSARERGLLILGGSDFNPDKNHWQIGTGDNDKLFISFRRFSEYESYRKRKYGE